MKPKWGCRGRGRDKRRKSGMEGEQEGEVGGRDRGKIV